MSHYAFQWAKRQCVGDSTTKTVLKTYANWASEDYSTWVTNEELLIDTELNIQTIRKARTRLIEKGYLIETDKRIGETRSIVVYQMVAPPGSTIVQAIDQRTGETVSLSPPSREEYEAKPLQKRSPSKSGASSGKRAKGDEKASPTKIGAPPNPTSSPSKSHAKGGEIPPQAPPNLEPNKADIALESREQQLAREAGGVDTSDAAAAAADDDQKAGTTPLDVEARLTDLLIELEAERGKRLVIDRSRDRVHIVTWVGRQLTEAELRVAHARAAGARQRDRDDRAVNVGFVAQFVSEVLAERETSVTAAAETAPAQWWLSDSGIGGQGKRVRVERKRNESTPDFLIRVAKESGRGPWIDYVLKREQGSSRYQDVIQFFGDALMPTDHYAS
ncbi:hypothetical protein [Paraburkholderia nodosa]|uniref:hypothetical protein n=1 Tax=Paraburkholderia nodosa TaxID=392320 RepID=UPI000488803D|nr:hypothetical protein [Paraburkholderia nodosa]